MTVIRDGSRIRDEHDETLGISDAVSDRLAKTLIAESPDPKWTEMAEAALRLRAAERKPCTKPGHDSMLARCSCKAWEEAQR